eukprot:6270348-Prymnesium_polylepis.1
MLSLPAGASTPAASTTASSTATAAAAAGTARRFDKGLVSVISPTGKSGLLKFFGFTGSAMPQSYNPDDSPPTLSCDGNFPPNPPRPPRPPSPPRPPPLPARPPP